MNHATWSLIAIVGLTATVVGASLLERPDPRTQVPPNRREVVFWHFWGGADRRVVDDVVDRFNRSQDRHFVRAVAMPGNNLDLKLFLAVTGGDPPDLVNQDDPIMADWAERGAIMPLDEIASREEMDRLQHWLVPPVRLGTYRGRMYALCNGLDIRAFYFNQTILNEYRLAPPTTLGELDRIAEVTTTRDATGRIERFGYLPDPRRLWAWGIVFGGEFFVEESQQVNVASDPIVQALEWMKSYRDKYGADTVASFRQGDQSLPGKTFPLLADRYVVVMDGQWRVRDILASQEQQRSNGEPITEFGVCPLPAPPDGVQRAGWVNGNFFLVPRGTNNAEGAWEFMKFWSGFGGHENEAARACVEGGWIPVSQDVVNEPQFRKYLEQRPLFSRFVELAAEPNQIPTPIIPGAPFFQRTINDAAAEAMYVETAPSPRQILEDAGLSIQSRLDAIRESRREAR